MKRFLMLFVAFFALSLAAMAQCTFDFGNFNGISASFIHHVYVTQGCSNKIEVQCPQKYIEYLDYHVSGGILHLDVDFPKNYNINNNGGDVIIVKVQMEDIRSISLSGAAKVFPKGNFHTSSDLKIEMSGATQITEFCIEARNFIYDISGASKCSVKGHFNKVDGELSGASKLYLKAEAKKMNFEASGASQYDFDGWAQDLNAQCSGASSMRLKGEVTNVNIICSGASKVYASKLEATNAKATASGASMIEVYGDFRLELHSSGMSTIRYYGNPKELIKNDASISRGR